MRTEVTTSVSCVLRDRCRALGLATFRCDLTGRILDRDTHASAALLDTPIATDELRRAASLWSGEAAPGLHEIGPGAWLCPVPEGTVRARRGYTVALYAGTSGSGDARHAAEVIRASMRWSSEDVSRLLDQGDALRGMTEQLTDSYETLDALYSIGRSMQGLQDPAMFIDATVRRLHASLRFQTVFARLSPTDDPAPALRRRMFVAGRPPATLQDLERDPLDSLLAGDQSPGFRIVTGDGRLTDDDHREAVLIPLVRGSARIGLLAGMRKEGDDPAVSSYDIQLMESAAGFLGAFLDNVAVYEEQRRLFLGTLHALTAAIDAKDRYTCGHSERVAHLSTRLALASGMDADQAHRVWIAGLVHDVGKIGVPEAVLCKQGRLTDEEFDHIKRHPRIGHHILRDLSPLADVLPGVLHHHEKFDGRGYPDGLAGERIPHLARIIALADTFDAMSSTRSYRPAMPRDKVLDEIRRCAGTQFDPGLAALFVCLDFTEYDAMVNRGRADQTWTAAA